jgi:hypothetical protein
MPAYDEWVSMAMAPAGEDRYNATVPLTPEGLLYYFEAVDDNGNAANFPNFLEQTPYCVIEGWDAQSSRGAN